MQSNKILIQPLSSFSQQEMRERNTWKEGCPVSLDRLRCLAFSYYDFDGNEQHDGELTVLDAVAQRVSLIFQHLHHLKFPIAQARRLEHYWGDDDASMADNNTSCFNYREITGGGLPSIHSYGLAIDVNPIQNPALMIENADSSSHTLLKLIPAAGKEYLNRCNGRPGMAELIVDIFKENGFRVWGGQWQSPLDWQHFQTPRSLAKLLAAMSFEDAHSFFEMYITQPTLLNIEKVHDDSLVNLYKAGPQHFMASL